MYAVIEASGRQYRVELGSEIELDKMDIEPGATVELGRVLLVAIGDDSHIGQPVVDGARVTAEVLRQDRGDKIVVFKYRPKARRRVKHGHRSELTVVRVSDIVLNGRSAAEAAEAQDQKDAKARAAAEKEAQRKAAADQALADKLTAEQEAQATQEAQAKQETEPKKEDKKSASKRAAAKPASSRKPAAKKAADKKAADTKAADTKAGDTKAGAKPKTTRSRTKSSPDEKKDE
jgi:large subunit ribosomal protein L21